MTVRDAGAEPGGMMRYGIPKYRLPRDILDAEIGRIVEMGVALELGTAVTDLLGALKPSAGGTAGADGFDAAFVAAGAHIGQRASTCSPSPNEAARRRAMIAKRRRGRTGPAPKRPLG